MYDALILATAPDPKVRDGAKAVRHAERACQLTRYKQPEFINTLASAYAEAGRYLDAIKIGERAADLALRTGARELNTKIEKRILLYHAGKPYHAPPQTSATNHLTGAVTKVSSDTVGKEAP